MAERKIVLFGGTFNPIHLGHTKIASGAAEYISAEKVIFIPAKRSPLKTYFPKAGDEDRLKMIELAIAGQKSFEVNDYELTRSDPSYTLYTVRQFQADYGSDTLIHWLVGADSIDELSHWYGITELIDECILAVMHRAGCEVPNFEKFEKVWGRDRVKKLQSNIISTPLIDISSTEIRARLACKDVSKMLNPAVVEYIREHGLYKP